MSRHVTKPENSPPQSSIQTGTENRPTASRSSRKQPPTMITTNCCGVLPARVRSKIQFQHSQTPELTACWMWTAGTYNDGHGRVSHNGADVPAHRYVYEQLRGPLNGARLKRLCPNRLCVNPNHLEKQ